jgi:hypothetical protein
MRRPEEKAIIMVEAIGLVFIVLASCVFEFANNVIEERHSAISDQAQIVNNLAIQFIQRQEQSFMAANYRIHGFQYNNVDVNQIQDPDMRGLQELLSKKEIPESKYMEKLSDLFTKRANEVQDQYNRESLNLVNLASDKMLFWVNLRSWANLIRIFAIVLSMFLYLQVFFSIGQRIKKEEKYGNF